MSTDSIRVSELFRYPIKSCRGERLSLARVDDGGIQHDREMMLVDENARFLSQRTHPRMALIEPHLSNDVLSVTAPGMPPVALKVSDSVKPIQVFVWQDVCDAFDFGMVAAQWFSDFLGIHCRLVRMDPTFVRRVNPKYAISVNNRTRFSDGFPLLLISQASLDDLNARLTHPVPMNRFRPNIVVDGCKPFAEDHWRKIQIDGLVCHLVKPCVRCVITTTDQETAQRDSEPLQTLATFRNVQRQGVLFGQNAIHETRGILKSGQPVTVLDEWND